MLNKGKELSCIVMVNPIWADNTARDLSNLGWGLAFQWFRRITV